MALWRISVVVALITIFQTQTYSQVVSDFNTDADGWTAPGALTPGINYSSTGGNPGGYVFAQTPGFVTLGASVFWIPYYFNAPAKFEGDMSAYYGGNLRYDASQTTAATGIQRAQAVLTSNQGSSIYYYPFQPAEPPAFGTWETLDIKLSADYNYWKLGDSPTADQAFEGTIRAILADLASLQIQGLYQNANVQTRIDNVTLYPPLIVDMQPQSVDVCEGNVITLSTSASNNPNITYQWQILGVQGIPSDVTDGGGYLGSKTATLTINTAAGFGEGTYVAKISGTAVDDKYSTTAVVVVNDRPDDPTVTGAASCTSSSLVLTAAGGQVEWYRWYTSLIVDDPIPSETSETYTTPVLTKTTTYYVSINNGYCESARIPVEAHIGPPSPPTVIGASSCDSAALILTANGGASKQYRWYTQQTGGTAINNETGKTLLTPVITETTTYYVAISNGQCESTRTPVVATIGGPSCQDPGGQVLEIFNAVSPNKDGKNDVFFIRNIDTIAATKKNHVTIFNRWGDLVWEGNDYDNTKVVFTGLSKNNSELPSGTYFFKIEFPGGKKTESGYIALKR